MPKVNIYQQQSNVGGMGPQPNYRGDTVTSALAAGLPSVERGLNDISRAAEMDAVTKSMEAKVVKRQEDNDAIAWSGKVLSDAHIQWDDHLLKAQEQAEPGANDFTPKFLADFDKFKEETLKSAPTDAAKKYLGERLDSMRTSLGSSAVTFEAGARRDMRIDQSSQMIENNMKVAQDDPSKFVTVYAESKAAIDALDVPPKEKTALLDKLRDSLPYAATLGRLQRDPQGVARALRGSVPTPEGAPSTSDGGSSSFPRVMDFIFKKEGGYNKNDGNGPVNMGINQHANPDVDVKSLTKDGATGIYKARYWNAIDGDHLPAGVALMAMDAAVNQGVGFARDMLQKSGGDIGKMAQIRANHYASLIEKNPAKYGKYANTWSARLTDATKQAQSAGGSGLGNTDTTTITIDHVRQTGDAAIDSLSFQQRIQLINQADTLTNQQQALAREQLKGKVQDFTAMAATGVPVPAASIPTVKELVAAHGEVDGLRMYNDEVKPMVELNSDLQTFSTKSIGERQSILSTRAPVPGDGYADSARRFGVMVDADLRLRKEMADDPSAYSIKYSPVVKQAFANLQNTPADDMGEKAGAAQAFVMASLAEQKRLGVTNPTILPKNVADSIVRQFFDQKSGGQNAAVLMQQQASLWGKNWPAVYGQMSKDLPGAALVIGSGVKPQAAELLARAAPMKMDELKEGLLNDDVKATMDGVQSSMVDFQRSLAPMAGGTQTFGTFNEQAQRLALMYVRSGDNPNKAAERAFDDLIGSKYEFVSNSSNKTLSYRVPKQHNPSFVESGADRALRTIDSANLEVPVSLYGLDKAQAKSAYVSALKSSAYWVTAPDESGLVLYANGAAVLHGDGKPFMKDWEELTIPNVLNFSSGKIRRAQ